MIREGYIEKIVYKSDETGYCVMSVEGEEGEEIFVGTLPGAGEGLYVIAEGEYVNHPQYDILLLRDSDAEGYTWNRAVFRLWYHQGHWRRFGEEDRQEIQG